tara:strand:- start:12433 stop:13314 length:882 start_codon:yes stop_codon:yes gene_type:complete
VLSCGLGFVARFIQSRNLDFFFITGLNYVVGFVGALTWMVLAGGWQADTSTIVFGMVQGAHYALTMLGSYLMFQRVGLGVTLTLINMAVIVPTVASSMLFNDRLMGHGLAGVALLVLSIGFVGRRSQKQQSDVRLEWWYWPLVIGLIALYGAGQTGAKAFEEISVRGHQPTYVVIAFATAVPIAFINFMVRSRIQPDLRSWRHAASYGSRVQLRNLAVLVLLGIGFGITNVSQLSFLVLALRDVPGTLVFPIATASLVLFASLAGSVFWRERYGRLTVFGGVMAIIGLVLVNV